jgi:hypothetical protein
MSLSSVDIIWDVVSRAKDESGCRRVVRGAPCGAPVEALHSPLDSGFELPVLRTRPQVF